MGISLFGWEIYFGRDCITAYAVGLASPTLTCHITFMLTCGQSVGNKFLCLFKSFLSSIDCCTFTFKSTWGVTRDSFDLFDISAEGPAERDMVQNIGNASKPCEEVENDFGNEVESIAAEVMGKPAWKPTTRYASFRRHRYDVRWRSEEEFS
jgi:hypothetical protein